MDLKSIKARYQADVQDAYKVGGSCYDSVKEWLIVEVERLEILVTHHINVVADAEDERDRLKAEKGDIQFCASEYLLDNKRLLVECDKLREALEFLRDHCGMSGTTRKMVDEALKGI